MRRGCVREGRGTRKKVEWRAEDITLEYEQGIVELGGGTGSGDEWGRRRTTSRFTVTGNTPSEHLSHNRAK